MDRRRNVFRYANLWAPPKIFPLTSYYVSATVRPTQPFRNPDHMPKAYYNEIDLYCAEWLYNLQKENLIAPGDIDTRPIQDVCPNDLKGYSQHHFFAGIGGWSRALRLSDWPDHREVWTGSCPCQPFSLAGKRGGFADDRHLWPYFRYLIAIGRPAIVFGEQVASAAEWLGLVRGDLEALDYAVGAMPVEAASAGADHLRDRFWFVADDGSGRCAGSRGGQSEQPRRAEVIGAGNSSSLNMEYAARISEREPDDEGNASAACGETRSVSGGSSDHGNVAYGDVQRSAPRFPRSIARQEGDAGIVEHGGDAGRMANPDFACEVDGHEQRGGQFGGTGGDQETRDGFAWVLGADGKARRVKPGVRLLAHGIPNRVGKLRGFGNAIDPRPAAAFIQSVKDSIDNS